MMEENIEQERGKKIAAELSKIGKKAKDEAVDKILSFNKKPEEVKTYLDKYIIGQELGKKTLSVATAFHYRRFGSAIKNEMEHNGGDIDRALQNLRFIKKNILLIGPTGCGKTYSLEKLSEFVNVPLVIEDLTKFSSTGYVGRDVQEIATDLLSKSNGNKYLAQFGIVFLDEFDKIASTYCVGKDVNGLEVQNGLLKILEGTDCVIPGILDGSFSTKYNLFVVGGAFDGIKGRIEKILKEGGMNKNGKHWSKFLTNSDLEHYGIERQLLGRLPIKVVYDELDKEDLIDIMEKSQDSPLKSYASDFAAWGIDLKFKRPALELIADHSNKQGIGARGLITTIDRILLDDMYRLPGNYNGKLVIDEKYVKEKI